MEVIHTFTTARLKSVLNTANSGESGWQSPGQLSSAKILALPRIVVDSVNGEMLIQSAEAYMNNMQVFGGRRNLPHSTFNTLL